MASAKKRVLIIDDSEFVRNKLKTILENIGLEVVGVAEDGLSGVKLYRELNPDVVTIDMVLPSYFKGIDCLRTIRQINPNAVSIMVSSVSDQKTVLDCIKAGAKNYILKPFDANRIREIVENL